jgi:hypothetical protein
VFLARRAEVLREERETTILRGPFQRINTRILSPVACQTGHLILQPEQPQRRSRRPREKLAGAHSGQRSLLSPAVNRPRGYQSNIDYSQAITILIFVLFFPSPTTSTFFFSLYCPSSPSLATVFRRAFLLPLLLSPQWRPTPPRPPNATRETTSFLR